MASKNAARQFVGIDFGTTNSCVAWYDPKARRAAILRNAEGEEKTPSVVYYGEEETLVGKHAEDMLRHEDERWRVVSSIKREIVSGPVSVFGDKRVRPVDTVAEILRKLKADAEEYHFHEPVTHAVITCPAQFDLLERNKIKEAGELVGFEEITMLEEPVAAAIAYAEEGQKVGNHMLVYDLGGGTFDVAVLVYDKDESDFRLAMPPKGIRRLGGDDFDRRLYDHFDTIARDTLNRGITPGGDIDYHFLRECRARKENLSSHKKTTFSSYLTSSGEGAILFKHSVDRDTFEGLIRDLVDTTANLTGTMVEEASHQAGGIDTVVLIGGSSRVPLVGLSLEETLSPLQPQRWQNQDFAVALGAAYRAQSQWGSRARARSVKPVQETKRPEQAAPLVPVPVAPQPAPVPQPTPALAPYRVKRNYLGKALLVLFLLYFIWPVGLVANIVFLNNAKGDKELGYETRNVGCLKALLWWQIVGFITSVVLVIWLVNKVL